MFINPWTIFPGLPVFSERHSTEEIELRNRLLRKLQNRTITEEEALKLKEILEKEKEEAEKKNDTSLLWAIGIVLGAILLYLFFKDQGK